MKGKFFFLLLLIPTFATSQIVWENNYGGSSIDELVQVKGGINNSLLLLGSTLSEDQDIQGYIGQKDALVILTDLSGTLEWSINIGGSANDEFRSAVQTNTGDWYLAGKSSSTDFDIIDGNGSEQGLLCLVSQSGELQWCKTFGEAEDDEFFTISLKPNGNLIISGAVDNEDLFKQNPNRHSNQDVWLLETNAAGELLWETKFGGTDGEQALDHTQDPAGNIYLTGYALSNDMDLSLNYGLKDIWIIKTTAGGDMLWQKSYGGNSFDEGKKILYHNDKLFIAGSTFSNTDTFDGLQIGQEDGFIFVVDPENGDLLKQVNTGGILSDRINDILIIDEQIMSAGFTKSALNGVSGYGGTDYWIRAFDLELNTKWTRTFGGSNEDVAQSLLNVNNTLFVGGSSYSTDIDVANNYGLSDIWLLQHDWINKVASPPNGNIHFEQYKDYLLVKELPEGNYQYLIFDLLGRTLNKGSFTVNDGDIRIDLLKSSHFFINIVHTEDRNLRYSLKGIQAR